MSYFPFFNNNLNAKQLKLITGPSIEPVTLSDMKGFLMVDGTADDALITLLIKAARESAEKYMNRAIINQQYRLTIDHFSDCKDYINLPKGLVQSVENITVYNLDNSSYTVDTSIYTVLQDRIVLNYSQIWPVNLRFRAGVEINYTVGYGTDVTSVPSDIILGIMNYVSAMYNSRGTCEIPSDAKSLLDAFRIYPNYGMG